ncbi:MAG: endolytic transglycosylase MltG [Longimicrobiales bacterium]
MSRPLQRVLLGGFLAGVVIVSSTAAVMSWRILESPMAVPESGEWLNVAPGTPLTRLANDLSERGVLEAPRLLSIYGRLSGQATRIHAGEYLIPHESSPRQLLEQLVSGEVFLHQITVVDGWRFEELLAALRDHEAVDSSELNADAVMANLGEAETHPEGQFYPDTYRFPRDTSALEILKQAHEAMDEQLELAWSGYRATSVLASPYEALVLASIIEKETALAEERHRIAGVFHRRLERGMRLQTDPTVIYGLGAEFDGNLRRSDLARDTPYNTYTRAGLPPTPIALPGGGALSAAVDPESGSELYFVATGRGDGSHYFSTTLEEHNAAVARYLQQLRSTR